jgi:hypothetical protein
MLFSEFKISWHTQILFIFTYWANSALCGRPGSTVRHKEPSCSQDTSFPSYSPVTNRQHIFLRDSFYVPGTRSGKQHPISLVGFGLFDGCPLAGGSGVPPCTDNFSARVSWKCSLDIFPPFFPIYYVPSGIKCPAYI